MTPKGKPRLTNRPPDSAELDRLVVRSRAPGSGGRKGRILQYRDPITGNVFSARQAAKARAGGLNHEQIAELKSRGKSELVAHARNARGSNTLPYLAERYASKNNLPISKALRSRDFLDTVDQLRAAEKSTSPKGKRAKALVKLGLRNVNDRHRVGTSRRKKLREG